LTRAQRVQAALNGGVVPQQGGGAGEEDPVAEIDVFDRNAFENAVTPPAAEATDIRNTTLDSMQANIDKLAPIEDDLPYLQGREVQQFRNVMETLRELEGTEADGGLNNWQLDYIERQKKELDKFMTKIEKERKAFLKRTQK
jgi:hypothetical protein